MDFIINDVDELSKSFDGYVDRMIRIRSLSSPEIHGIKNAEAYSTLLLDNFSYIGTLAEKNRELISKTIDPILNSRTPLDPEVIGLIEKLNDQLLNATEGENIDLPLASLLTDRLLLDAEGKGDIDYLISMLDKVIESSYLLVNMTKRVVSNHKIIDSYRKKGTDALEKLLVYLDKEKFLSLSQGSREIVLINSRYGASLYESQDPYNIAMAEEQLRILENALKISEDPFFHENAPDFDWRYHTFRIYDYLLRLGCEFPVKEIAEKILGYADECIIIWKSDPEYYKEFNEFEEIEGRRLRIYYITGLISNQEYRDRLYEMYEGRKIKDYSSAGYDMNVEYPLDYLISQAEDDISEKDMRIARKIYRSALEYIFHMPKLGMLSVTLDPYSRMLMSFREYPGIISFEDMGLCSMAALHPPTYIHSKMVANITRCLTRHLLQIKPELFEDFFSYLGEGNVPQNRDKAIDFAYHAAVCHDFGKLMIIDTIFVYGRKLFDLEFDMVKEHPNIGYKLLSSYDSTKKYADVARGHHLWYDGSRGYPMEFDASKSPVKVIIDIVTIADCMDAATDSVGRSYNRGKTLADYEQEVIRDAGSRYAPWGPEILRDENVRQDLEHILGEDRHKLYMETFKLLTAL